MALPNRHRFPRYAFIVANTGPKLCVKCFSKIDDCQAEEGANTYLKGNQHDWWRSQVPLTKFLRKSVQVLWLQAGVNDRKAFEALTTGRMDEYKAQIEANFSKLANRAGQLFGVQLLLSFHPIL